jgi:hypothetical protein
MKRLAHAVSMCIVNFWLARQLCARRSLWCSWNKCPLIQHPEFPARWLEGHVTLSEPLLELSILCSSELVAINQFLCVSFQSMCCLLCALSALMVFSIKYVLLPPHRQKHPLYVCICYIKHPVVRKLYVFIISLTQPASH